MALNVLSACHSIGTLSNSTTESSSRSLLDRKSSFQPKRLTYSSANGVQVLRVCDSYPGPTNGLRAEFNKEVWPQSARNDFVASEYLLPRERGTAVHWSSYTLIHTMTIQNYQRDALNIIYSLNIITLLYMFRVSSTHLQEDIVVHKLHMVPSLSIRVLVSC